MARFSAWLYDAVKSLRRPLDRDAYRVLGIVCVLGVLLMATIGFVAVGRWEVALILAIFAIPASLLVGVLNILWLQRHGGAKRPDVRWVVSVLATIILSAYAAGKLQDTRPSMFVRIVLVTVCGTVVIFVLAYLQTRKRVH